MYAISFIYLKNWLGLHILFVLSNEMDYDIWWCDFYHVNEGRSNTMAEQQERMDPGHWMISGTKLSCHLDLSPLASYVGINKIISYLGVLGIPLAKETQPYTKYYRQYHKTVVIFMAFLWNCSNILMLLLFLHESLSCECTGIWAHVHRYRKTDR